MDGFDKVWAYFHEPGIGKSRTKILKTQLQVRGGHVEEVLNKSTTHIIVGSKISYDSLLKTVKNEELLNLISIVTADWLSNCFAQNKLIAVRPYIISKSITPQHSPKKQSMQITASIEVNIRADVGGSTSERKTMDPLVLERETKPVSSKEKKTGGKDLSGDSDYVETTDEEEDDSETEEGMLSLKEKLALSLYQRGLTEGTQVDTGLKSAVSKDPSPQKKKMKFACDRATTEVIINKNKHITDKLEELMKSYQNSNDRWRVYSYNKAITELKRCPKEITTWEEARQLPNVGSRLADKIWEIVDSGHLRRLDHIGEEEKLVNLFMKIWGVGAVMAKRFVELGYKSLEDLRNSGLLNRVQLIGLNHYNDFNERIPRDEVKKIEAKVTELALSINSELKCVTCGSYRRGKVDCGDVDILITHPDGRSHKGVFQEILRKGRESGFLTDDLVIQDIPESQSKYLGVCRLTGAARKFRRLDIIVVPYGEYPCALLYFTGSAYFNRSMRLKAHKMGMSLSEHAIYSGVIRKGSEVIHKGLPLPVTCEKDVFEYLDTPFAEPHERNL